MSEVAAGIFRIDVCHPTVGRTCCYLITQDGHAVLVDCGAQNGVPTIMKTLEQTGVTLDWLIVTHAHLDHAAAAGQIMSRLPETKMAGHPSALKHLAEPAEKLAPAARKLYGAAFYNEQYHPLLPVDKMRLWPLADGEVISWLRPLRAIHTPGHAWHHLSVFDETADMIYAGDAYGVSFLKGGDGLPFILPVMPPTQFVPEEMANSIEHLRALNARLAGLSHYGVVEDSDFLAEQQQIALKAWCKIADEAATDDNCLAVLKERLQNWVGEAAKQRGIAPDTALQEHAHDIFLSVNGLFHWLQKR